MNLIDGGKMNEEMTFGQALDWMNEDNSREVVDIPDSRESNRLRIENGKILFWHNRAQQWQEDKWVGENFKYKWRPYVAPKPKSVIEEAIEREMGQYWKERGLGIGSPVDGLKAALRNIANVALDEAIAIVKGEEADSVENCLPVIIKIDALKVKE